MPTRASRGGKRADFIQNALREVETMTGDILKPAEGKNIFAQALSALGASKGGKARAENLSAKRRVAIARKAARARWLKKP
jgi:ABC-type phosphate/phosphonate transport system ATPase subunit